MSEGSAQKKRITKEDLQARIRRNEFAQMLKDAEIGPGKFAVQNVKIINLQAGSCEGDWFEFSSN
jgi:hypothetical protein